MLLGQSIFQSVLTRLEEEEKEAGDTALEDADFRIRGLGAGFVTPDGRPTATEIDTGAYFDYLADWLAPPADAKTTETDAAFDADDAHIHAATPAMPPHLFRLSEEEITEDLALSPKDTDVTLAEKRRQFAKLNHPDRVGPAFRENATTRMKIANLLIDRALASRGRP